MRLITRLILSSSKEKDVKHNSSLSALLSPPFCVKESLSLEPNYEEKDDEELLSSPFIHTKVAMVSFVNR